MQAGFLVTVYPSLSMSLSSPHPPKKVNTLDWLKIVQNLSFIFTIKYTQTFFFIIYYPKQYLHFFIYQLTLEETTIT